MSVTTTTMSSYQPSRNKNNAESNVGNNNNDVIKSSGFILLAKLAMNWACTQVILIETVYPHALLNIFKNKTDLYNDLVSKAFSHDVIVYHICRLRNSRTASFS